MTTQDKMFELAKKMMELTAEFSKAARAVQLDTTISPAERHWLVDEAIDVASAALKDVREDNSQFLEDQVEHGTVVVPSRTVCGLPLEGKTYKAVEKSTYSVLNKDSVIGWAAVLQAAAKVNPSIIQQRITDSKVTPAFLKECQGLVGFTSKISWSITKIK